VFFFFFFHTKTRVYSINKNKNKNARFVTWKAMNQKHTTQRFIPFPISLLSSSLFFFLLFHRLLVLLLHSRGRSRGRSRGSSRSSISSTSSNSTTGLASSKDSLNLSSADGFGNTRELSEIGGSSSQSSEWTGAGSSGLFSCPFVVPSSCPHQHHEHQYRQS